MSILLFTSEGIKVKIERMEVILFGISREIVGVKNLKIDPAENIQTVGTLKKWMKAQYPQLEKINSLAVAVDGEYADDAQNITDENEVALIPPVSGG